MKHGMYKAPEYRVWADMRRRCLCATDTAYKNYGGRGIKICARWFDFENFYSDMEERLSSKHQLDRIDNDGDYCKENCSWSTKSQQSANQRTRSKSGIKGICWDKNRGKWLAHIKFAGKLINLGRFDKKCQAARVRRYAELKYEPLRPLIT